MLKVVYLSLGSNVGDREAELRTALSKLHSHDFQIERVSSLYETDPVEMRDQPQFLNIVLEARTTLYPMRLLLRIANIEREMGRRRTVTKGPRNIDIDILLFGRFTVETPQLQIPHPRMTERRFVLEPLVELSPDLRHPVTRRTMREILAQAPEQRVRRLPGPLELSFDLPRDSDVT
jgi:2-amino-4-hydroxy-6-hydroxymethyldihydropteridine diphosphokinase